jgi:hypothetical protein
MMTILHRWLRRCALVLAPTFSLLSPPAAVASKTRIAVPPVALEGEGTGPRVEPDRAGAELTARIARALRSDYTLVSVPGCDETEQLCSLAQAKKVDANWLLEVALVTDGADQTLRFSIRYVESGETIAAFEDVCELCGRAELDAFIDTMIGALGAKLRALEPEAARITIVGMPDRAAVTVDGRRVGTLPWQGEIEAGEHEVMVERRGFLPTRRSIDVVGGTHERVQVSLERDPAATSRAMKISGWTLVAAGAASAGGGAVLLAMDGRPHRDSCAEPDTQGRCPNMYSSRAGGIALTVLGGTALIVGGSLLIYEHVRFRRTKWRAGIQPGMRRASLQIQF